jgi:hypothetical protein
VVLMARSAPSYQETVDEINKAQGGHKAIGVIADTVDAGSLDKAFETIRKELPDHKLAAAVYNPSSSFGRRPFMEITRDQIQGSVDNNVYESFPLSPLSPLL